MICVFFYDGNSRRLNRKWFYGEAGNRTCDPWFTRHRFIPYTTAASLVYLTLGARGWSLIYFFF